MPVPSEEEGGDGAVVGLLRFPAISIPGRLEARTGGEGEGATSKLRGELA